MPMTPRELIVLLKHNGFEEDQTPIKKRFYGYQPQQGE